METYGKDFIIIILGFLNLKNLFKCKQLNHFYQNLIEKEEWFHNINISFFETQNFLFWKKIIKKHNFTNYNFINSNIFECLDVMNMYNKELFDILCCIKKLILS